ncbi:hypothetical protein HNQ56_001964 [Anaerotaenia torta]
MSDKQLSGNEAGNHGVIRIPGLVARRGLTARRNPIDKEL